MQQYNTPIPYNSAVKMFFKQFEPMEENQWKNKISGTGKNTASLPQRKAETCKDGAKKSVIKMTV